MKYTQDILSNNARLSLLGDSGQNTSSNLGSAVVGVIINTPIAKMLSVVGLLHRLTFSGDHDVTTQILCIIPKKRSFLFIEHCATFNVIAKYRNRRSLPLKNNKTNI